MHSLRNLASIHASFYNPFNSQRSLSKCSAFKLNLDAARKEWRTLVIVKKCSVLIANIGDC